MIAASKPAKCAILPVVMLSEATIRAVPTSHTQNRCPGIQDGTAFTTASWRAKCRIPKIANGTAKNSAPNRMNAALRRAFPVRKTNDKECSHNETFLSHETPIANTQPMETEVKT